MAKQLFFSNMSCTGGSTLSSLTYSHVSTQVPVVERMYPLLQRVHALAAPLQVAQLEEQAVHLVGVSKKYPLSQTLQVEEALLGQSKQFATVQVLSI